MQSIHTSPIIVVDNNKNLQVNHNLMNTSIPSQTNNKLLVVGAVGKMRVGKSTALNNFYNLMTSKKTRIFDEAEQVETNTRGIHIYYVKFSDMNSTYQSKIRNAFQENVDVVLMDCEGTESSDNVGTAKLYLMNMLINSMIHIHVSKAIDMNFANKLSQALISCNEVISSLKSSEKEILPGLKILIKDTSKKAWENAQKSNSSLTKFEDLLKDYPSLLDYYSRFPDREIRIISPPKTDDDGRYVVDDTNTLYWKQLEDTFSDSFSFKKLKTREELLVFITRVAVLINENNLMNVKSELDSFYEKMFENEKEKLFRKIVESSLKNINRMIGFSPEEIENCLLVETSNQLKDFYVGIENISCKWVFENLKEELMKEIENIIHEIQELFTSEENKHTLRREQTSTNENIYENQTKEVPDYEVKKFHDEMVNMCQHCGSSPNSQGCMPSVGSKSSGGNVFGQIISTVVSCVFKVPLPDLFSGKQETPVISWSHKGPIGMFCRNCRKSSNSKECNNDVIKHMKEVTEEVLAGFKKNYSMDQWKSSDFKNSFSSYLKKIINKKK